MISFLTVPFEALTVYQLHEILMLRAAVFVVEQNCPFQDPDNKDPLALHLLGQNTSGKIVAYARLFDVGIAYPQYACIGRVVTSPTHRGSGIGRLLMQQAITVCEETFGLVPIKIGAQAHLSDFYASLGFEDIGVAYLEDGIPHIEMVRKQNTAGRSVQPYLT